MVVRKMKEKCKDAARMRREKERTEFNELSKLLPLPASITSQLDKASIIRLTSSYLRMRSAFPQGLGANWGTHKLSTTTTSFSTSPSNYNARVASFSSSAGLAASSPFDNDIAGHYNANSAAGDGDDDGYGLKLSERGPKQTSHLIQHQQPTIKELGSLILQTLDGFVFALHRDGKIMYISETASVLLGLPQIDLTGSSIFDYIHPADHNDLLIMLSLNESDRNSIQQAQSLPNHHLSSSSFTSMSDKPVLDQFELGRAFSLRMKCILPKRNAGLVKNGYKSIHCTGYLKVKRISKQPVDKGCSQSAQSGCLDWDSYALVAVGHSLLPTASTEIKLSKSSFMFRANLDMRVYYMEATVSNTNTRPPLATNSAIYSLGHQQNSLIGQSLYQLIHLADSQHLEEAHRSLLSKGQVVSKYIRLMRRDVGYIWVQMQASLVSNPRSMPRPLHIVGICTILGDNNSDQSKMILDEPVMPVQDESNRSGSSNFYATQMENHATNQRRKIMKNLPNSNSLLTIKEQQAAKVSKINVRRATTTTTCTKRNLNAIQPMKRAKHSHVGNVNNKCKLLDERVTNPHDGLISSSAFDDRVPSSSATKHYEHGHSICSMRRPSDDTCSVASSSASASASSSSATTISNFTQVMIPCPPPSVSSCSSSSNSSSSSLSTPNMSNAAHPSNLYLDDLRYHPIQQQPSNDIMESFVGVEPAIGGLCQQTHSIQQCYPLLVDDQHSSNLGQLYSDPNQCQSSSYWPSCNDKVHYHTQSSPSVYARPNALQSNNIPSERYYYGELAIDADNQLSNHFQYINDTTLFQDGSQHLTDQTVGVKSGPLNTKTSNLITHCQYEYPTSHHSEYLALSVTTPTIAKPSVTPCFVGSSQSF